MEQLRYLLGVVTLALVGAAGWFIFSLLTEDNLADAFQLRLKFEDVRGLRAGADVRYRGVRVGQVFEVGVTKDGDRATVRLVLADDVAPLACQNSKFWIVSPRFNGLTDGATGLDTLVRDSYVAFLTPTPPGARLASRGEIVGHERPFRDPSEAGLDPVRHGDLKMFLHAPENHGLKVGAEIKFRGMTTGDIRAIELAEDGTHVRLELRVLQEYRETVTDASTFWVARPRVSGALMSGIAVEDLNALLTPFVGYHTEPGRGVAVADGHRVLALSARPDIKEPEIKLPEQQPPVAHDATEISGIQLVKIDYEAVEEDWLSANDRVKRTSNGILFVDSSGRTVVVTCRTACDASYFMSDMFGTQADIVSEAVSIRIPRGPVLKAGRSWVDPEGFDLALLVIEDAPSDLPATPLSRFDFEFDPTTSAAGATFRTWNASGEAVDLTNLPAIDTGEKKNRGSVTIVEERIGGLLAQKSGAEVTPSIVPLSRLPAELRPGR